MPVEVISYMMSDKDINHRIKFQLVLQCAPFLKGIKAACMTNVKRKFIKRLGSILKGTGISYRVLAGRNECCLVFFYRREEFAEYLKQYEVREFLESYGYQCRDTDGVLQRLSARVCQYSAEDISFPHEIGAFLDFPIRDVEGFIQNKGRDYLLAGYWKVYHNPVKAQMLFHAYDQARISAVNEFLTGKPIQKIAVSEA